MMKASTWFFGCYVSQLDEPIVTPTERIVFVFFWWWVMEDVQEDPSFITICTFHCQSSWYPSHTSLSSWCPPSSYFCPWWHLRLSTPLSQLQVARNAIFDTAKWLRRTTAMLWHLHPRWNWLLHSTGSRLQSKVMWTFGKCRCKKCARLTTCVSHTIWNPLLCSYRRAIFSTNLLSSRPAYSALGSAHTWERSISR